MAYDRDTIFKNIGQGIAVFNVLDAGIVSIEAIRAVWIPYINTSGDEDLLAAAAALVSTTLSDSLSNGKSNTKSVLRAHVLNELRERLNYARRNFADILDKLTDDMLIASPVDTVKQNTQISAAIVEFNDGNDQLSGWTFTGDIMYINTDAAGRMFIDLAVGGAGHQVSVYNDSTRLVLVAQGSIAGDGTVTLVEQGGSGLSGTVELDWTGADADIYLIVVPLPDIDNAGSGYVTDVEVSQQTHDLIDFILECTDISGGVGAEGWVLRSTNKSSHGTPVTGIEFEDSEYGVKFTISRLTAIVEQNDDGGQLSDWDFSGAVKTTSAIAGKSAIVGNTDYYGRLYISLSDAAGTRTINVYKDAARTLLVAQYIGGDGNDVILAEQNSSGLSGTVDLAYTGDDLDIWLILPFEFAVGDKFYFSSQHDRAGIFQTFFVQQWDKAFPSAISGAQTVSEAFAT